MLLISDLKYDGRVLKEIRTLQNNGFEVEVILSKLVNDNLSNYNFKIHLFNYIDKKNVIKNFLNKFSFCKDACKLMKKIVPDIIHCNDLNTLYAGYLYKKKINKDIKLVYDAHELFPESQSDIIRKTIWNILEHKFIKFANKILCAEENRAKYMKKKYKLPEIVVIENFPTEMKLDKLNYIEKKEKMTIGKKKILYLGVISKSRSALKIIRAMQYLDKNYVLVLIGVIVNKKTKSKIDSLINKLKLEEKIVIIKPIPNKEVISYINSSDIGLVFYKNINLNNYYCASNKLYEFIMCKKLVITNAYPGLIEVVKKNNYGTCLNKITDKTIAKAISTCTKDIDKSKAYGKNKKKYTWENQAKKFLNVYE